MATSSAADHPEVVGAKIRASRRSEARLSLRLDFLATGFIFSSPFGCRIVAIIEAIFGAVPV
jgi:hypothetical protein